jgi:DNA mismatch repair ATPase MutS
MEENIYNKRMKRYENLKSKQKQTINFYSVLRLVIFISAFVLGIIFLRQNNYIFFGIGSLIFSLFFIVIAKKHGILIYKLKLCESMVLINEKSLERKQGKWKEFKDIGNEFIDESSNYSYDLDIFGKNSLFQYINQTKTYYGRYELKKILSEFPIDKEDIIHKQEAIKELASFIGWRQKLLALTSVREENLKSPEQLVVWSKEKIDFYENKVVNLLVNILPIITIISGILHFAFNLLPYTVPAILFVCQIIITGYKFGERVEYLNALFNYKKDIEIYWHIIEHIEKKSFNSVYLRNLKAELVNNKKESCTKSMKEFNKIVTKISDRKNMFYLIKNMFFLSDYKICNTLNKWKNNSGQNLQQWLSVIGKFEAVSSLAVINFDNPKWTTPQFTEGKVIKGEKLAHPLITNNRISNYIDINEYSPVLLITGSNMAGKSTYLRTVGINLLLAYTGASVCASSFTCPLLNIYSCMRISDDIDQNISSFYGEIIRIKKIIDAVKRNEKVFFLLDEIFKGTNSIDRHTGAISLVNKLEKVGAVGLVSTHDLELAELEKTSKGKIKNYHFEEYYKDDKIYFDYKLKKGVCTTRNASYLMKMAGLEVE